MPRLLDIAELGDPVLRQKTTAIKDPGKPVIRTLVENMFHTTSAVDGVGLAAPQVSESVSMFIIASEPNERYPEAPELGPIAVINPEILSYSDEIEDGWEGCLSIPGFRGIVPRHKTINVRYRDTKGKEITTEFSGFPARIFQHEYDHLNGILFLDRIDITSDLYTEKEYRRLLEEL